MLAVVLAMALLLVLLPLMEAMAAVETLVFLALTIKEGAAAATLTAAPALSS